MCVASPEVFQLVRYEMARVMGLTLLSYHKVSFIVGGTRCTQRKPHSTGHLQTVSHNVVSSTPRHERDSASQVVIDTDCSDSWKSNYHAI
jgi:hypothetical protein